MIRISADHLVDKLELSKNSQSMYKLFISVHL